MNILILGDHKFIAEAGKNIKDHKLFCIVGDRLTLPLKKKLLQINKNMTLHPHKKLKNFNFFRTVDWTKVTPLDQYTIEGMRDCESEVMKMYERIKSIKPNDSFDTRKSHYLACLRYWSYYLAVNKIDVFLAAFVPHMGYDYVIYNLCKFKGIKTFTNYFLFPDWGYFIESIKDPMAGFEPLYGNFKYPRLKSIFEEYLNNKPLSYKPITIPNVPRVVEFQKKVRIMYKDLFDFYKSCCKKFDISKPFIYVPLHYQYEASTCPLGGVFVDQLLMIEILSFTGYTIYVKEHPHMSKNRSIAYYNRLTKMRNVHLIPVETNHYTLIDKAFAVATVTGTAGWETILKGKCCLLFGNIYYQYLPGCFSVGSYPDVMRAIQEIRSFKFDKEKVEAYLKGLEPFLHPLNYNSMILKFKERIGI